MGWIVFTVLALIVALVGLKVRVASTVLEPEFRGQSRRVRREIAFTGDGLPIISVGVLVLWVIATALCSISIVENGHVGLVKQFGEYVGEIEPGMNFKAPYQSVVEANGKIQKKTIAMHGKGTGSAVSKETQPVYMDLTVNYHIDPAQMRALYQNVGPGYYKTIIEPRAQQAIKAVTVEYLTTEIAPNREKIRVAAAKDLAREVADNGIIIDDLLIRDLDFSQKFLDAIERKQVATEDAKAAQEKVKQVTAEAAQAIEKAKGEANAAAINGKALRENPESLEKLRIEKFNPTVQTIITDGKNGMFFNLQPQK